MSTQTEFPWRNYYARKNACQIASVALLSLPFTLRALRPSRRCMRIAEGRLGGNFVYILRNLARAPSAKYSLKFTIDNKERAAIIEKKNFRKGEIA